MKIPENRLTISCIFEIQLARKYWQRISTLAEKHSISYSWIVRLCLFKLLQRPNDRLQHMTIMLKEKFIDHGRDHRHMLCLYGEDERYVRFKAATLGMTISKLVRCSLELYLDQVEAELESGVDVVLAGTKLFAAIEQVLIRNLDMEIHIRKNKYVPFSRSQYWAKRPITRLHLHSG